MNTAVVKNTDTDTEFQEIILRRKFKLVAEPGKSNNPNHVKAIAANIASLGFVFSKELIEVLETQSQADLKKLNNDLKVSLSVLVGDNVKYKPLFRNFPEDIPDDMEVLVRRIIGHIESVLGLTQNGAMLSCGHIIDTEKWDMSNYGACPICQHQVDEHEAFLPSKERKKMKEKVKMKTIGLAAPGEIFNIFENLLSSNTSVSETDKEDIERIFVETINSGADISSHIPEEIPFKEVLALVAGLVYNNLEDKTVLNSRVKTATDVLRIAVSMSGGDISLAENTYFKKFKKAERRFLLGLLENTGNITEDMLRYKEEWKRLGEILHPGDYKNRFESSYKAFKILREDEEFETFNSKTEALISSFDFIALTKHLSNRPGEFARRLDLILRYIDGDSVFNTFESVADKVATPVLLQVMSNFRIRTDMNKSIRIIMPKGSVANVKVLDEDRTPVSKDVSDRVISIIENELRRRFSELPKLGKVWVDPNLSNYVVPFSQRSASKALHTIPRGSHVDLPKGETIRAFTYWKGDIDVDLSAVMYDDNWNYIDHISYTNLTGTGCSHSGDILRAPNGAAEFIDLDKKKARKAGVRYIAISVFSYSHIPYCDMEKCFAGVMTRKDSMRGKVYEAKTVKAKFDLTADTMVCIPMIIDLKEKKVVWTDIALSSQAVFNNVESNKGNMILMGKAMTQMLDFKANMHDLMRLHAEARGTVVEDREDAKVEFTSEELPFEIDTIVSEYLK